jgi:HD superfamily phosphohydrolase
MSEGLPLSEALTIIRDPVHGFIKLNKTEMAIVASRPFQRLRYIRQLALTNLVYPGAEHSRFAHSLGVMNFATRIYDTLLEKHRDLLGWNQQRIEKNRQLLRLAALLHDIGHGPFSHASEELLGEKDHEPISSRLMSAKPLSDLIDGFAGVGITAKDVVAFFSAESIDPDIAFLREIYSGELDADKLDYLLRDSLYTGVHYGRFDFERLINSLILIEDPKGFGNNIVAVEYGGLHALEALVLARYFMFTQVYFHKIRRAFDHHLLEFLKRYVGKYPTSLSEYLDWDDNRVFALLQKHRKNDDNARRILERKPFKEAFTTHEHINDEQRTRFQWMWKEVRNNFKGVSMFCDTAEKSPHKFEKVSTYIMSRTTEKPALVWKESGIIKELKNIEQYRIFVGETHRKKIHEFCQDFWLNQGKKTE